MISKVHVTVHRHNSHPDRDHIDLAEMFFPSYAKASQFLDRLGFTFVMWELNNNRVKFTNPDTQEFAYLYDLTGKEFAKEADDWND